VVTVPGVGTHRSLPQYADVAVGGLPVHELAIGMANRRPVASADYRTWAWDVAELIHHTADRLDVPYSNIICLGHSFHGHVAILTGLMTQAGHMVVGAPPLLMGSVLDGMYKYFRDRPSIHAMYEFGYEHSIAHDPDEVGALDALLTDEVATAMHEASIEVFTSPEDMLVSLARQFAEAVTTIGNNVSCEVVEGTYPGHDAMGPEYYRFARQRIEQIVQSETVPPPPPPRHSPPFAPLR